MTLQPPQGSPRKRAILCLANWMGSGQPIQEFIEQGIHASTLSRADRQLAVMLVMTALRRQQYLDSLLARFAKTPLRKMKPLTLAALRVGIVQICFLQRIPDSAAVNETVKALKKCRQPAWLIRFVNGTLRAVSRAKDILPPPETAGPGGTPILEHPTWLTDRWSRNFGHARMTAICRGNCREPVLCLQANTSRTTSRELAAILEKEHINVRPGQYAPDSLLLPGHRGAIADLPGFEAGLFHIQDQAASLACLICTPLKPGGRYLDACAGLGGKTSILARRLPAHATLSAVEPDKRRTRLLAENIKRLRLADRVTLHRHTLEAFAATTPKIFDGILLDVPCSGTGVIRKHPDIRWNRQPGDIPDCQARQRALLQTAATLLAPGGFLVYATCSLEPEENWHIIKQFLADTPTFELQDCSGDLPTDARQLVNEQGCFAPLPCADIDGFFAAKLRRKREE